MRPIESVDPPAAHGTMTRTGFEGYSWAYAPTAAASAARAQRLLRIIRSPFAHLFGGDLRRHDQLAVTRVFGLHQRVELFRRAARGLESLREQRVGHAGQRERFRHVR